MESTRIGKYHLHKGDNYFTISYITTMSDYVGVLWYLLSMVVGQLMIFVSVYKLLKDDSVLDLTTGLMLGIGVALALYSLFMIVMSLAQPKRGIFRINYSSGKVVIPDFPRNTVVNVGDVKNVFYEITSKHRPRQLFAMICLRTADNPKVECFIVRTPRAVDTGRAVEQELHETAKGICRAILDEVRETKATIQ